MSTSKRIPISLRGAQAERFEEIKEEIEDAVGHEVRRTRVISELMMDWDGRKRR